MKWSRASQACLCAWSILLHVVAGLQLCWGITVHSLEWATLAVHLANRISPCCISTLLLSVAGHGKAQQWWLSIHCSSSNKYLYLSGSPPLCILSCAQCSSQKVLELQIIDDQDVHLHVGALYLYFLSYAVHFFFFLVFFGYILAAYHELYSSHFTLSYICYIHCPFLFFTFSGLPYFSVTLFHLIFYEFDSDLI